MSRDPDEFTLFYTLYDGAMHDEEQKEEKIGTIELHVPNFEFEVEKESDKEEKGNENEEKQQEKDNIQENNDTEELKIEQKHEEEKNEKPEEQKPKEPERPCGVEYQYNHRLGVRIPVLNFIYSGKTKPKKKENHEKEQEKPKETAEKRKISPTPKPPETERPKTTKPRPQRKTLMQEIKEYNKQNSNLKLNPSPPNQLNIEQNDNQNQNIEQQNHPQEPILLKPKPKTARRRRTAFIRKPKVRLNSMQSRQSHREIKQIAITKEVMHNPMALPSSGEDLALLIAKLKQEYGEEIRRERWKEAQKIARIINSAESKYRNVKKAQENNKYIKEATKHNELCAITKARVDKWNDEYEEFKKNIQEQANAIIQSHELELQEFDKNAPRELPRYYQKMSKELRELRDQEKLYAMQLKFKKAKRIQMIADQKEELENEAAYKLLMDDFMRKRENLIKQQNKRLSAFVTRAQATQFAMLKKRERMTEGYCKRIGLMGDTIERRIEHGEVKAKEIKNLTLSQERIDEITQRENNIKPVSQKTKRPYIPITQETPQYC